MQREQQAAKARGEKAGPAGTAERQRLEALARARQEAAGRAPVPAPDGGWRVATDAGGTEVWWAVRRSQLRVEFGGAPSRTFRVGVDRGALTDVGLPATLWWRTGGDDPFTAVVLVVAALGVVVTFPWRLAEARTRAANRNALVAALRG